MVASGGSGSITYSSAEGALYLNQKGMINEASVSIKTLVIAHKAMSDSVPGAYLFDARSMQTLNVAAYLFDGSTTSYSHAGSWVSGIHERH